MISMTARSEDSYLSATGCAGKYALAAMSTGHLMVNALEGIRHADDEIQAAPRGLFNQLYAAGPWLIARICETWKDMVDYNHTQNEDVSASHWFY